MFAGILVEMSVSRLGVGSKKEPCPCIKTETTAHFFTNCQALFLQLNASVKIGQTTTSTNFLDAIGTFLHSAHTLFSTFISSSLSVELSEFPIVRQN